MLYGQFLMEEPTIDSSHLYKAPENINILVSRPNRKLMSISHLSSKFIPPIDQLYAGILTVLGKKLGPASGHSYRNGETQALKREDKKGVKACMGVNSRLNFITTKQRCFSINWIKCSCPYIFIIPFLLSYPLFFAIFIYRDIELQCTSALHCCTATLS